MTALLYEVDSPVSSPLAPGVGRVWWND